jgi:hypothetical protein
MKNKFVGACALGVLLLASGNVYSDEKEPLLHANLKGFQEVPAVSTVATGQFRATIITRRPLIIHLLTPVSKVPLHNRIFTSAIDSPRVGFRFGCARQGQTKTRQIFHSNVLNEAKGTQP